MNPIAVVLILLGLALVVLGVAWAKRRSKIAGITLSLVGFSVAAIPFLVSLLIAE